MDNKRIIVPLDMPRLEDALALAARLDPKLCRVKIGKELFVAAGPEAVARVQERGFEVFLDLKFHDIPNTVAGAVAAATRLGVWMLNVHAAGGSTMMRAAKDAAAEEATRRSRPVPLVIAVTMLTSLSQETLGEIGVSDAMTSQVGRLAALAQTSGLDGVVASPLEIDLIRRRCGDQFTIVTPGIRGPADKKSDQRRTLTAAEALAAGATYLVVGRPIIAAADPRAAAERIVAECPPR